MDLKKIIWTADEAIRLQRDYPELPYWRALELAMELCKEAYNGKV